MRESTPRPARPVLAGEDEDRKDEHDRIRDASFLCWQLVAATSWTITLCQVTQSPYPARADRGGCWPATAGDLDVERLGRPDLDPDHRQDRLPDRHRSVAPGARPAPVRERRRPPGQPEHDPGRLQAPGGRRLRHEPARSGHPRRRPATPAARCRGAGRDRRRDAPPRGPGRVRGGRGRGGRVRRRLGAEAAGPAGSGLLLRMHEGGCPLRRGADRRGLPGDDQRRGHAPRGDRRAARALPLRPDRDDDVPRRRGAGPGGRPGAGRGHAGRPRLPRPRPRDRGIAAGRPGRPRARRQARQHRNDVELVRGTTGGDRVGDDRRRRRSPWSTRPPISSSFAGARTPPASGSAGPIVSEWTYEFDPSGLELLRAIERAGRSDAGRRRIGLHHRPDRGPGSPGPPTISGWPGPPGRATSGRLTPRADLPTAGRSPPASPPDAERWSPVRSSPEPAWRRWLPTTRNPDGGQLHAAGLLVAILGRIVDRYRRRPIPKRSPR